MTENNSYTVKKRHECNMCTVRNRHFIPGTTYRDMVCSHYHVLVICKWCSLMILLVTLNVVIHTLVIVDRLERWFDRD